MPVKLYNSGKRTISGSSANAEGKLVPWVLLPKSAMEFEDDLARRLRKMYPGEMLSMEDVKSQFDATHNVQPQSPPPPGYAPRPPQEVKSEAVAGLGELSPEEQAAALQAVVALRVAADAKQEEKQPEEPKAAELPDDKKQLTSLLEALQAKLGLGKKDEKAA